MRKHPAAGMKAWWKSFRYKILAAAMAAAVVIAAAAVPVGADEATASITLAYSSGSGPNEITIGDRWSPGNSKYYGFCVDYQVQNDYTYLYEVTIISEVPNSTSVNYTADITDVKLSTSEKWGGSNYLSYFDIDYNYTDNSTHTYLIPFNTANLPVSNFRYLTVWTSRGNSNPDIYQYSSATVHVTYDPDQSEFDRIMAEIEKIQQNQIDSNVTINQILQQQIINNNNWTHIITYGSNYEQIDQTTINNFGTAESQLSSAEGAVRNKSGSLKDSVSSQWSENTTKTRAFVNTVAPATAAITNTITSVVSVMPDEVQTLLTVVPLLLFIGWLLGRIGGG